MTPDSPLRKLVRGMAGWAKALRGLATSPGLQGIHNDLCDVLDALNEELKDEDEGMLAPDWEKISKASKAEASSRT